MFVGTLLAIPKLKEILMSAKQKKQKSASPTQTAANITLAVPYYGNAGQESQWLKAVNDFAQSWKGTVDLFFLDLSAEQSLQVAMEENEAGKQLYTNNHVTVLNAISSLGEGLQKAAESAQGDHLVTWKADTGVKLTVIKEWAAKYKNQFPANKIITGNRGLDEKSVKNTIKEKEGTGNIRFRGFTSQRIEDPGNPVKVYPVNIARYLFAKVQANSGFFEAEALHWAEEEKIGIKEVPVQYTTDEHYEKPDAKGGMAALQRAVAFKWRFQVAAPLKHLTGQKERKGYLPPANHNMYQGYASLCYCSCFL